MMKQYFIKLLLKLAIIDSEILWQGSLNVLLQVNSREVMTRIEGKDANQMFKFLEFSTIIK